MKLQRINISNFASFGPDQSIDFSDFGSSAVLIIGENMDTPGADSNGSGKSSLFHAIPWCLFGKIPTKVSPDDVVRSESNLCSVSVCLINGQRQSDITRIRSSERKKDNIVEWVLNGSPQDYSTSTEVNNAICKELGLRQKTAFLDFQNSAYFSMEAMTAFTSRSGKSEERMALISRFLGLDVLDIARSFANDRRKTYRGTVDVLKEEVIRLKKALDEEEDEDRLVAEGERLTSSIQDIRKEQEVFSVDIKRANTRDRLNDELSDSTEDLRTLDQRYDGEENKLRAVILTYTNGLEQKIDELEGLQEFEEQLVKDGYWTQEDIDEAAREIRDKHSEVNQDTVKLKLEISTLDSLITSAERQLEEADKCPNCGTELVTIDDHICEFDRESLENNLSLLKQKREKKRIGVKRRGSELKDIKLADEELQKHRVKLTHINEKLREKQVCAGELALANERLDSAKKNLSSLSTRKGNEATALRKKIEELEKSLESYSDVPDTDFIEDRIQELNSQLTEERVALNSVNHRIKNLRKVKTELLKANMRLAAVQKKLNSAEFWNDGFPIIRRWRIDHFLPSFESEINRFLSLMEVGTRVSLATTKKLKSSRAEEDSTRAQFTINVNDERGYDRPFETFSTGESRRIGMAVGFALRELTMQRGTNQMEFLLLDEIVDSLDQTGMSCFFNLLPHISGLKMVISHDQNLGMRFENVIRVVKEDGLSRIEIG